MKLVVRGAEIIGLDTVSPVYWAGASLKPEAPA